MTTIWSECRRWANRAAVPVLLLLTLLAGVATQAYAQTLPTVSFANTRTTGNWVHEWSGTHNAQIRLDKAQPSDITIKYRVGGTATPGSDYVALPGTVTVPAGQTTATIPVTLIDDTESEGRFESVSLTLVADTGYRPHWRPFILNIQDDDTPQVTFAVSDLLKYGNSRYGERLSEEARTHDVRVELKPAPRSGITLKYTVGGTATPGSDFTIADSGTLTVPAGANLAIIPVTIIDDAVGEFDETVVLTLVSGSPKYVVSPSFQDKITLTIPDNEPRVSFGPTSQRVGEGSGTRNAGMILDKASTTDLTLTYTVGGTATAGSDYTALSGTVTVPKGARGAVIRVTLIDDAVGELDETVVLTLVGNSGYGVGSRGTHTFTIVENDPRPAKWISFASASQRVDEGSGTRNVGVTLSPAPTTAVTFTYTVGGTAPAGSDFTIASSGTLTVPAGATTATIPVTVIDDSVHEGDETVVLTLIGSAGYSVAGPGTHTLTIVDDDGPTVSFASASQGADEGSGTRNVGLTLDKAPEFDLTLAYTVGGTATAGSDFTALSGTVTVPKGATTAIIPVTVIDDTEGELDETIVLTLAASGGYKVASPGTHTLLIADNDELPKVHFVSAGRNAGEGSGTHNVEVRLSPAPATEVTFAYKVGGTARAGSDFTITNSGTVTVPAGATTAAIPVTLIDDSVGEGDERVVLKLATSGGYRVVSPGTHTLTIVDDESRVSFASKSQSVDEGSGTHNVGVKLNKAPTSDITVTYTVGGTATAGSDFTALSGTVTVPAGATTATIPVTVIDDGVGEHDETVVLTLVRSAGYQMFFPIRHTLAIVDNEPTVSFASASQSVGEGSGTHEVEVRLSKAPASDVTLAYTVGGTATAGSDFTIASSGTLSVPKGATTATIPVTIIDDSVEDNGETVVLTLTAGNGYAVGATGTHTLTIQNHEPAVPTVTVVRKAGTASSITEGGDAAFTLTATPAPTADLPVTVTVAADGDWGVAGGSRTVTIPATGSATLTLATADDAADEPDGSVSVTVVDGSGYTVGASASGTVSVQDDDAAPACASRQTVADYLIEVRDNPENTAVRGNPVHIAKWNRVLEAIGHDTGTGLAPMPASDIHANAAQWPASPFKAASDHLSCVEAQGGQDQQQEPEIAVSGGSAVTEGGDAVFTLTASPAPAADLAVSVTVATDGDWGVTAGSRTVTIPTSGSATLTLATAGDATDEPDGSVSVTVTDGSGYTVGSSASATVSVQDDDDPAPACAARQTVVDYLVGVRDNPKNTAVKGNPVHIAKWNRVLEAIGHDTDTGLSPMPASEIHGNAAQWPASPFKAASDHLSCVEAQGGQDQQQEPEIAVSAGSAVTEGGDAVFTLTATPAPAADLAVSVTVAADGDWGITAGSRTVTIPTSGSATLTLATAGDATDEPDGSVTVTVVDGSGYTVGSSGSDTVAVSDDDAPLPVVTLAAGAAVTEGGSASFTLTASPAPAADLAVSVTVATDGDWGVTAGSRTVTIPASGSATLTLATTDDATDEPDGSVSVTVADGSGWTAGDPASGSVTVQDDDAALPVVTLAAGAAVTEGGNAVFTLTASPAPAADLPVSVSVAAAGDYGITAGTQTVTIPTTGSATLTLATADDGTDEPDGSATVTVETGSGYTVGASASGTVAVRDDDLPPPVVTIAAKAGSVSEGGDAVFTLTADRAPDSDITVTLAVSETGDGDHVAAADEGPATLVIAKGATEAAFIVATVNDDADEPDGTVSVAVTACAGCTAGDPASASVEVKDDDVPSTVPALSVGDSTAKEGGRLPIMPFTVRLAPAAQGPVRVYVSTRPSTPVSAEPGQDYAPGSSDLTFQAGETEKVVWIRIYDDSHDEGSETFEVVLSDAKGAAIGDGVAVGTIVNDDPMPAAFLARFGRTVAEQALDGIAGRMSAPRTAGMQGAIAGQAVGFGPTDSGQPAAGATPGAAPANGEAALAMAEIARGFGGRSGHDPAGFGNGPGFMFPGSPAFAGAGSSGAGGTGFGQTPGHSRTMTARDALLGSSFSLTGEKDGTGGSMAFWGRAAQGSFDGREGTFSLDGTVTTGMLGADYARGRWLVGLALAQSDGEGDYRDTDVMSRAASQDCPAEAAELCRGAVREGDGKVEASLTAAVPYAALRVSERLKLWGAAGYGAGEVTLKTELGGRYKADTSWSMAAAGMRGDLLAPPAEGSGPALAVTSDALWTRTASEKTRDLAASDSDVTRLRVGLEGSYHVAMEDGASLVPKLELGARHDGGDAETGFGVELGGGVKWTDPGMGLSLDLSGRTLIAHGNDDLKDRGFSAALAYDPAPATQRGASLSLRQDFGGKATGGLDALFAPDPLDDRTGGGEAASRWAVEAAYGLPAFGGRWTGSPHMGLGLATAVRDYSVGWRLAPEAANAPDLSFGVKATRRESGTAAPEHTVGVEIRATW